MFFAGFNTDGSQQFCSYYGGVLNTISNTNVYSEDMNATFDNVGNLYLWGKTRTTTGYATPNGSYPNQINPQSNMPFAFLVKFSPKANEMAVSEVEDVRDLILYDNPNNGNFT